MKTIAVNDIKVPYRITVRSRAKLIEFLRGAHNIKDAIEVTLDGVGSTYYICAMDEYNEATRKAILRRAAIFLKRYTPHNFNEECINNDILPDEIFKVICGPSKLNPKHVNSVHIG